MRVRQLSLHSTDVTSTLAKWFNFYFEFQENHVNYSMFKNGVLRCLALGGDLDKMPWFDFVMKVFYYEHLTKSGGEIILNDNDLSAKLQKFLSLLLFTDSWGDFAHGYILKVGVGQDLRKLRLNELFNDLVIAMLFQKLRIEIDFAIFFTNLYNVSVGNQILGK